MRSLVLSLPLLFSAAVAVSSTPPTGARDSRNGTEVHALPGGLTAMRGGVKLWQRSAPLPGASSLRLWLTTREVLLLSRDWEAGTVLLSAYALETGKPLWTNRVYTNREGADAHFAGLAGRVLLLSGLSGEPAQGRVIGLSLDTGKALWEAGQDLLGHTETEALVLDLGSGAQPMNRPHLLPLTRVAVATGQREKFTLTLPPRPTCGPLNYQGRIPDLRFTGEYLYAFRKDACGKFIVRFDWRAGAGQKPLVYPDRRPPTPRPPATLH